MTREESSLASSLSVTFSVRLEGQARLDSSKWEPGLVRSEQVANFLELRHEEKQLQTVSLARLSEDQ